jgi:hypothetical protein
MIRRSEIIQNDLGISDSQPDSAEVQAAEA